MKTALKKGLPIFLAVLIIGATIAAIVITVITLRRNTFTEQEDTETTDTEETEKVGEMVNQSNRLVGGETEPAVCDAAIIENSEIDYTIRINPGSLLQEEQFTKEFRETLAGQFEDDDEVAKGYVLYGHDEFYISICPVISFAPSYNSISGTVQVFFFTKDMEEAGSFMFYEMDGEVCYEISWISTSGSGNGILKGLSESPDTKYIVLVNGIQSALLSEDNELSAIGNWNGTQPFEISGDYYHALDYETLAVSYEDIVDEDNLILFQMDQES